eukprot:TRINITY_DN3019_c0_g1_i3.p1 TRINITY_DN3019_c0_g1~~TRINITY_DN3019_c0_g1_i3.p1  ORF type:complete len:201 (+),score=45.64 TRINITY_DN3019_c0_g1_i3:809-1411(+)
MQRRNSLPYTQPHARITSSAPSISGFSSQSAPMTGLAHVSGSLSRGGRRAKKEITEDEKQEIREAFDLFDSNKAGKIEYREVKVAMRALGFAVSKAEVKGLMAEYSKDEGGGLELHEFMEIMSQKIGERDPVEELAKAFRLFDDDSTGKISLKNLRKVAKDFGEDISDEDLSAMIDEFDRDGDGEISEMEFYDIMKHNEG